MLARGDFLVFRMWTISRICTLPIGALLLAAVPEATAGAVFLTGHDPDFHAQVYARRGKKAEAHQQLEVALKTPVFADAAGPASSSTPCGR
jgi:hypothetical protein